MSKNSFLVIFLLVSFKISSQDVSIEIDISEQRLYLIEGLDIKASYPVSSSKYGEGSIENSFKTPLGYHVVKEKIGEGAEKNTIFKARINTKRSADIIEEYQDSDDDFVTSRIMWLDGKEEGKNKGGAVDYFARYIYINGTHEERLIGTKASKGRHRMFKAEATEEYERIKNRKKGIRKV